MRNYGLSQVETATRIVLICPDCGQENSVFASALRTTNTYCCNAEDCDYIFDIACRGHSDFSSGFVDAWKRFYAALYPMRGARAR